MRLCEFADILEEVYSLYHRRQFVSPDPLEVLYPYPDPQDQEVVGFLAAALAYGRVAQILASVRTVLNILGPAPRRYVLDTPPSKVQRALGGFKHRFNTAAQVAALIGGMGKVIKRHGSLEQCLAKAISPSDATVLPALNAMVQELHVASGDEWNHLLCDVDKGGACKRLNLFLRWMCRRDEVDVGCWRSVPPAKLLIPLDVHMHRLCLAMGATRRNQTDLRTVEEVTAQFAAICPDDPVRYDFSLTRLGIRPEMSEEMFVKYFEQRGRSTQADRGAQ